MILSENEKLKRFVELRTKYIDLLDRGKLTKQEFNEQNQKLFTKLDLKPFSKIDSFEKALFNYNYYNTKAKISLTQSNRFKELKKLKKYKREENFKINYYNEKDKATQYLIENESAESLEAYYINLHSRNLSKTIYEVYFKDRNQVILHSRSETIKKILQDKGSFFDEQRASLIDKYVING